MPWPKLVVRRRFQEEDDDDDVMEEHEAPVMKPRGKREQVIAPKFEVPKDWKPPVHDKTDAEFEFLKGVMETNRLMKSLTPSDRGMLLKAFRKVSFKAGDVIIKQGDKSDNMDFYVLESGTTDITIEGKVRRVVPPPPHGIFWVDLVQGFQLSAKI